MSSSPPGLCCSHASSPRWKRARCAFRNAGSSAASSALGSGWAGPRGVRSGKNRSFSALAALPCRPASSRYAGYRRTGAFGSPRASPSTNCFSASTPRSITATASMLGGEPFSAAKLPSRVSQNWVASASPTMFKAPLTWCRCSGQALRTAASSGAASNLAIICRTRSSAWSTSAVIQDRVVVSAREPITPGGIRTPISSAPPRVRSGARRSARSFSCLRSSAGSRRGSASCCRRPGLPKPPAAAWRWRST